MHGRHLRRRGRWWHYYRNRPARYKDIEPRPVITFALRTCCISEAKLKAAQISQDLERQWEDAKNRGVSLNSQSASTRYAASVSVNQSHGFQAMPTPSLSDHELLTRLRYLIEGQLPLGEQKAVLGMVDKPGLSMVGAFARFWEHIADEWSGHSHDQKRCKRNIYLKSIRHFEEAVGKVDLYDIKRHHAVEFRAWWLKRKQENRLKSCTANREIDSIRRLITTIYDIDAFEAPNPFARMRLKADVKVRRKPLSTELIKTNILASGKLDGLHPDFQLLVKLVINTGVRPVEAIGMELRDIKIDHDIPHLHVRENPVRVLKTPHSERLMPLLGVSLEAAQELHRQRGWGKRLGKNMYATSIINRHFKTNGTFDKQKQSFYSLRHWFQDQLTHHDIIDRAQVQLMGHKFHRPTYGDGKSLAELRDIIALFAL
jgi:integrase